MRNVGGERVEEAVASAVALLRTAVDRDWEGPRAHGLEWSCRATAVHVAECLVGYAAQLTGRAADDYIPFELRLEEGAGNEGALRVIEATGGLLAAAVRTTPREVRAFHPYPFRSANREGFAAMGITEVLLHTHDIARSLGLSYEPPAEVVSYALTRIFPAVRPGPAPWPTLLWATGRGELPGRPPVTGWRWSNNLVITGDRLTLEGVTPASAADLGAGGDGGFAWAGSGPLEGTREGAGIVVKQYEEGVLRPEWGMFVLVRREDGLAVGAMGFHGPPDEDGRVEIGYDLVEAARGHGYATEALRALSGWALAREDVTVVCATTEPGNLASQAVLDRAGFTRVAGDGEQPAYELRG
ncbi:GNAT family N-acetyltransferase [Streptomyces cyaneogriseus]|uniref:GNAT family N-acetyltransferase n=1 Tax=Streptomyces cyaneogriseus TaxID=68192 RepID=UPI000AB96246|nr:GNAT family N-acetyltransferase [Streptomyces cyaneogriseus]